MARPGYARESEFNAQDSIISGTRATQTWKQWMHGMLAPSPGTPSRSGPLGLALELMAQSNAASGGSRHCSPGSHSGAGPASSSSSSSLFSDPRVPPLADTLPDLEGAEEPPPPHAPAAPSDRAGDEGSCPEGADWASDGSSGSVSPGPGGYLPCPPGRGAARVLRSFVSERRALDACRWMETLRRGGAAQGGSANAPSGASSTASSESSSGSGSLGQRAWTWVVDAVRARPRAAAMLVVLGVSLAGAAAWKGAGMALDYARGSTGDGSSAESAALPGDEMHADASAGRSAVHPDRTPRARRDPASRVPQAATEGLGRAARGQSEQSTGGFGGALGRVVEGAAGAVSGLASSSAAPEDGGRNGAGAGGSAGEGRGSGEARGSGGSNPFLGPDGKAPASIPMANLRPTIKHRVAQGLRKFADTISSAADSIEKVELPRADPDNPLARTVIVHDATSKTDIPVDAAKAGLGRTVEQYGGCDKRVQRAKSTATKRMNAMDSHAREKALLQGGALMAVGAAGSAAAVAVLQLEALEAAGDVPEELPPMRLAGALRRVRQCCDEVAAAAHQLADVDRGKGGGGVGGGSAAGDGSLIGPASPEEQLREDALHDGLELLNQELRAAQVEALTLCVLARALGASESSSGLREDGHRVGDAGPVMSASGQALEGRLTGVLDAVFARAVTLGSLAATGDASPPSPPAPQRASSFPDDTAGGRSPLGQLEDMVAQDLRTDSDRVDYRALRLRWVRAPDGLACESSAVPSRSSGGGTASSDGPGRCVLQPVYGPVVAAPAPVDDVPDASSPPAGSAASAASGAGGAGSTGTRAGSADDWLLGDLDVQSARGGLQSALHRAAGAVFPSSQAGGPTCAICMERVLPWHAAVASQSLGCGRSHQLHARCFMEQQTRSRPSCRTEGDKCPQCRQPMQYIHAIAVPSPFASQRAPGQGAAGGPGELEVVRCHPHDAQAAAEAAGIGAIGGIVARAASGAGDSALVVNSYPSMGGAASAASGKQPARGDPIRMPKIDRGESQESKQGSPFPEDAGAIDGVRVDHFGRAVQR